MKRMIFLAISFVLVFSFPVFAQSADEYVRNSKIVPDILNQSQGWVRNLSQDDRRGSYIVEAYENAKEGLVAYLYVINKDGVRQENFMEYGSSKVAKAAIKVNGKWYVGKEPFYDNDVLMKENHFKTEQVLDKNGNVIGAKVSLDTVEGLKELPL